MIDVNELRSGVTFELDSNLYKVIEYSHHKPGRGKAMIRTKVRDLRSGAVLEKNFTSGDKVAVRPWHIKGDLTTRSLKLPAKPANITLNDNLEALVILNPL